MPTDCQNVITPLPLTITAVVDHHMPCSVRNNLVELQVKIPLAAREPGRTIVPAISASLIRACPRHALSHHSILPSHLLKIASAY
jgi:hypothetical protein